MKILSLSAKNFWSFKELNYSKFQGGLTLINGHNFDENTANGSGKSAFANALCYSFLGSLPKKVKADEVINQEAKKNFTIEIVFEHNEHNYKIERGRKPNFLKFFIDGKQVEDVDSIRLQKTIEKTLGFTEYTFLNSVYFPQNGINLLDLNDSSKKDIFTDLFMLNILDRIFDKVKKDAKDLELKKSNLDYKFKLDSVELEAQQKNIESLQEKNILFEVSQKNKLDGFYQELNSISEEEKTLSCKKDEINNTLANAKIQQKEFLELKFVKESAFNIVEQNINNLMATKRNLEIEEGVLKRNIEKLKLEANQCPSCFQSVNKELLASLSEGEKLKLSKVSESLTLVNGELDKTGDLVQLKQLKNDLFVKDRDFTNLICRLEQEFASNTSSLKNIGQRKESILKYMETAKSESNPYSELILQSEQKKNSLELANQDLANQIQVVAVGLAELDILKNVFGPKGLRSYVFENALIELNNKINHYLSRLFDNDIKIFFENKTVESRGETKAVFETIITVNNEEVSLGRFSGGEMRRINFAINLAMSDIINARSGNNFSILLLDECFDGIDADGKKKCFLLLKEVAEKKDSIFVVDHSSEFQNSFDNMIFIEKRNGVSVLQ